MDRNYIKRFSILFIFFITSCAYIKVNSSYDNKTKINIQKVFIITEDINKVGFLKDFSDSLIKKLNSINIKTAFIFKDSLSFISNNDITLKINDFQPDAIIHLNRLTSHFSQSKYGYTYSGSTYYFSIRKKGDELEYWKAIITTFNEDNNYNRALNPTIDKIIKKIKTETM